MNEKMNRKLEHSVLGIYTVFSLSTFVSAILLHWNIFAIEFLGATTVAPWVICIGNYRNYTFRAKVIACLSWLNFTVYAAHSGNFTSMLSTMFAVIVLMGVFCIPEIVYMGIGFTTVIILVHMFVLHTIVVDAPNELIRVILHVISAYVISLVIWITIRTRLETNELLMENIRELEEVEQSKDDFLVNISHEIRTPINAVCGMSEAILQEDIPESVRSDIVDIQAAGRNLLATVSNILDFSELESGKMTLVEENYNITSTITDIINMAVTRDNGRHLELIVDCDAALPSSLAGDEQKLRRIVMNLLDNAIKFTKEGGIILTVSSRKEEYGINLLVSVRDSGIGISRADLEKIFQSFSQIDSRRNRAEGGVGLGLSITQALVRKMGGFLTVESEVGKGTEFRIAIPQKVPDGEPIVSVQNKNQLYAACYINLEKYDSPVVREGYERSILHMAEQLGIMFRMCRNLPELKRRKEIENYSHVFIGWEEYCEDRAFFEELTGELTVVLVMDYGQETQAGSSMLRIYKPFTVLSVAAIFNGQRVIRREDPHLDMRHRFVAPRAKVLVVDDNAMNLKVMARLLLPYRIKTVSALGGQEALEKIQTMDYDCVFLDHMMPDMDGVETLHRMRQKPGAYFQSVPVIAFTANAIGGAREMFIEEGFDDFIAKPIELSVLERMLRRYIPAQKQIAAEAGTERETQDGAPQPQGAAGTSETQDAQPEASGLEALAQAGINVRLGLSYCGDREGFRDIVRMYHAQGAGRNEQLEKLYREEDWKNYAIAVHAMKSNSKGIGAEALAELALQLEMAGKENRGEYIREHHAELLEKHSALLRALAANSFLYPEGFQEPAAEEENGAQQESADGEDEELQDVGEGDLRAQTALLREKLEGYESDGVNALLDDLGRCRYRGVGLRELAEQIRGKVDEFDFLGAVDALDAWEKGLPGSAK